MRTVARTLPRRVGPERRMAAMPRTPGRRTWALLALGGLLAALAAALGRDGPVVNPGGGAQVLDFFAAALRPRVDGAFLALTLDAALTTLAYAVAATALSLAIGAVGGVVLSRTWWRTGPRRGRLARSLGWMGARAAFVVPRSIHEVVWGLVLLSVLGLDPLAGVLAIALPFGAITAKVFSEILDEAPQEPYAALIAAGAGRGAALAYGLLPGALGDLISYGFYRFECAIRSAAILGLIGAGGLGFQLALSFQALRYEEMWTLLYALIALSGLADLWSTAVRARRGAPRRAGRDRFLTASTAVATALVGLAAWQLGLDPSSLGDAQTWALAGQLAADAWPPDLGPGGLGGLAELSASTLAMSVLAIALAFAGGVALAFPAARLAAGRPHGAATRRGRAARLGVVITTRGLLLVLRAIPAPVWALLALFVLFPGILPGALALGLYTLGVLGRLMAEAAENLDPRPQTALRAQGASAGGAFLYGVLPAAFSRFTAYGLYRWEVTIRETVVVGVVGAGGLGLALERQIASFDYAGVTATLLALIALTFAVDLISAAARRSLR